jgi:hypothetical protein
MRAFPALALFLIFPCQAAAQGAWFAGVSMGATDGSGYAGAMGEGRWAGKALLSAGRYRYESGLAEIEGREQGLQLLAMRRASGAGGWANAGVGLRLLDTELSRPDPGNAKAGTRLDLLLQADGGWRMRGHEAQVWAAASPTARDASALFRVLRGPPQARLRFGLELAGAGDPSYARAQVGLVTAYRLGERATFLFSAGAQAQDGEGSAYAGISVSGAR